MLTRHEQLLESENEEGGEESFYYEQQALQLIQREALTSEVYRTELERASASAELVQLALDAVPEFLPAFISDRLEEIFAPLDRESNGDDCEPPLLLGSLRSFLKFCFLVQGALDVRFIPGRTYEGEIDLQLLDDKLGDLSIRFSDDGFVLVAVISGAGMSSGRYLATNLLTPLDHFFISRWF